ncbi:hypothetical protein F2Q68_00032431 [Brassica cretica]|uniref:F-box associated beta-propeller type 1 domain-containing protein n=2 Tax=Brassica cretica TaxID=69181 RepID=A0A3N6Q652_BRACR|nr:hypothetical protein F2Q68_00032431 [Brassica cretica]
MIGSILGTTTAMSLKGDTYWLDSNISILRFDFTTEKLERLPLPSTSDEHNELVVLSVVREEKLALLYQYRDSTDSSKMTIWLTNTKTDEAKDFSWREFLVYLKWPRSRVAPRLFSYVPTLAQIPDKARRAAE